MIPGLCNDQCCSRCQCNCPAQTQDSCINSCKKQGKVVRPELCAGQCCSSCQCQCAPFELASCQLQCQLAGKVRVPDMTDSNGCESCICKCPEFDATSCQSKCTIEGKEFIDGAQDTNGCLKCQCGCKRDCSEECQGHPFETTINEDGCIARCICLPTPSPIQNTSGNSGKLGPQNQLCALRLESSSEIWPIWILIWIPTGESHPKLKPDISVFA